MSSLSASLMLPMLWSDKPRYLPAAWRPGEQKCRLRLGPCLSTTAWKKAIRGFEERIRGQDAGEDSETVETSKAGIGFGANYCYY